MGFTKKLPKVALGAWAWGNDGTFGDHYEAADLKYVYETAMKNGLNLWDTAYVYGMGTSEEILGELTKGTSSENLILSTKFTPQCDDGSSKPMLHMLETSLANLHTDAIDVWWIHNPLDVEKYTPMLIPLAKKGLIKEMGVSNHSLAEIKRANEILKKDGLKISAVQNHFSLLNRSSEDSGILEYCKENGIIFYAYMVLEQGALSGKYNVAHPFPKGSERANMYNPMLKEIEKLTDVLKGIGNAHGLSVAQVQIAWAIAKGTLPIVGVTKVNQVKDAVKAASITLSDKEIALMEQTADGLGLSTIRYWEKKME